MAKTEGTLVTFVVDVAAADYPTGGDPTEAALQKLVSAHLDGWLPDRDLPGVKVRTSNWSYSAKPNIAAAGAAQ
jgi:hypothetical protein